MNDDLLDLEATEEVAGDYSQQDEEKIENSSTAYDILAYYNTYNLSALLNWWGKKLIIPDFQRAFVWNTVQASEFVDTMLRGLPVPSFFFYDDVENNRFLVIDGQQRLTSLYQFIVEQEFQGRKFVLKGNIHPGWEGLSFDQLKEEDQERLKDALLNITIMRELRPETGQSSMYLAFQRINTGGLSLKPQEIRMAVSIGPLSQLLGKLARDERFDKWEFLRPAKDKANKNYQKIQELILRFWALYLEGDTYTGASLRGFLDSFFSDHRYLDTKQKPKKPNITYYSEERLTNLFEAALDDMYKNLDSYDFSPGARPTQLFFETIWIGLTYRIIEKGSSIDNFKLKDHIKNWKSEIGEENFNEAFHSRRNSSKESIQLRLRLTKEYFSKDL